MVYLDKGVHPPKEETAIVVDCSAGTRSIPDLMLVTVFQTTPEKVQDLINSLANSGAKKLYLRGMPEYPSSLRGAVVSDSRILATGAEAQDERYVGDLAEKLHVLRSRSASALKP